ncbi:alpha/beta hydrolase family protein [Flavivirga eckloniae]|uniref:Alpha/beta hydrolase n=1 Tax=Flavivirga eckloniae TaxID=1803846 RepID=A0A2K9PRE2_9FLAO|nr:alpha/beta fold hydrolase [Flavivirga eckloniae]AUP79609.1 alpha/beta hydrolase [Flavivirga eckloniae]
MISKKNSVIDGKHEKPILIDVTYTSNNINKPIIIFCHGYKGFKDWGSWNLMANAFAEAGFCFIKFNFSYNGGTIEQPIDFPDLEAFGNNNYTKELDDLESVIDWVFKSNDIKSIGDINNLSLIGHSRGGGIVLIKAEEDPRVKNVISLASICDFGKRTATIGDLESWKKDGVKYVLNGRTKQQMPHYYQFYENYIKNEERLTIKRAVSNLQIPYLIVHGDADTSISIQEAEKLHEWNPKSQLKIVEGANHVFGASHPWKKDILPIHLQKVIQITLSFLEEF